MPIETLEQELKNPRLQAALASAWWSEEEAELILSALERSGLTVREFAKRTQVSAARLYSRRQQRTRLPNYILPPNPPPADLSSPHRELLRPGCFPLLWQ